MPHYAELHRNKTLNIKNIVNIRSAYGIVVFHHYIIDYSQEIYTFSHTISNGI